MNLNPILVVGVYFVVSLKVKGVALNAIQNAKFAYDNLYTNFA